MLSGGLIIVARDDMSSFEASVTSKTPALIDIIVSQRLFIWINTAQKNSSLNMKPHWCYRVPPVISKTLLNAEK